MKNLSYFCSDSRQESNFDLRMGGFFVPQIQRFAAIIRLSNLSVTALRKSVMILGGIKGDSLSYFILIFHSTMPRINEDASNVKNSSVQARLTHETGKVFSFEGTTNVQVVIINGNPYFVAVDVCNALNLQNTSDRIKDVLDCDEYLPYLLDRSGQKRTVNIVCESGLYALIFQSRKPIAKKFRKWVTSEVLPAIRKTGIYETEQAVEKLTGQYIQVTGADGNLYLLSILKAIHEFIGEEVIGNIFSELRLIKKIKAARTLFPEYMKNLRNKDVKLLSTIINR